jgi:hypothetical protein
MALAVDGLGNVYDTNYVGNTIGKVNLGGTVTTFVSSSGGLSGPYGIAYASNTLYVASITSGAVSKVSTANGIVLSLVPATYGLSNPSGVAIGPGNLM